MVVRHEAFLRKVRHHFAKDINVHHGLLFFQEGTTLLRHYRFCSAFQAVYATKNEAFGGMESHSWGHTSRWDVYFSMQWRPGTRYILYMSLPATGRQAPVMKGSLGGAVQPVRIDPRLESQFTPQGSKRNMAGKCRTRFRGVLKEFWEMLET